MRIIRVTVELDQKNMSEIQKEELTKALKQALYKAHHAIKTVTVEVEDWE